MVNDMLFGGVLYTYYAPELKTHIFKYIEDFPPKTEMFQIKILICFIFLLKT